MSLTISPGFRATTYHIEYGTTRDYGTGTAQSASIGADNSPHQLSVDIPGLAPATTYHYRVVASNEIGTASGPDQTFTTSAPAAQTPPQPQSPKCKAGFVLRRGQCVRKPHRHHRHKRRHGNG